MTLAKDFLEAKNKRITLLGMSGVGKTHLAKLIGEEGDWFHFSGDYRIGAKHLKEEIIANIANKMSSNNWLKVLLENKSISVNSQVTFDNLEPISAFLGKVGNPEEGGLPISEFIRRQSLFFEAEKKTMHEVPEFIAKSQAKGFSHFINDAGGSLCELEDPKLFKLLSANTLIIYIKTSKENEHALIERAKENPKPMYYNPVFFQRSIKNYLTENNLEYAAEISPDSFVSWVFPKLIEDRLKKYSKIANKYGCTIQSDDLHSCSSANDVIDLISSAL
ncbi:ATPase [Pseudothioglobus sp. nBUS_23]|uniref:ATPase n=1 Tax=Pseudothioglobus sp. nBUS_23 TaxID=3395318 RepID=UPI003EB69AD3